MIVRYYIDPVTDEPHIAGHNVTAEEVEEVLGRPGEIAPAERAPGSQ